MDKRSNNGGHSTKSKGVDKRRNNTKQLLQEYLDAEVDYYMLKTLFDTIYANAINGDMKSASMFLSYTIGKPVDVIVQKKEEESDKMFPSWLND